MLQLQGFELYHLNDVPHLKDCIVFVLNHWDLVVWKADSWSYPVLLIFDPILYEITIFGGKMLFWERNLANQLIW